MGRQLCGAVRHNRTAAPATLCQLRDQLRRDVSSRFGPDRDDRELIAADLAETIRVETSIESPTKEESPDDEGWWVAVALPFETLSMCTGVSVSPSGETVWRGNFHHLGGKTGSQFATWNPMVTPEPDFHRLLEFGRLVFE